MLPNRYPLPHDVETYIADEQRIGRMLDYAVIVRRLQSLYEWSAEELDEPRLPELVRDGNPIYAWPFAEGHVRRSSNMPSWGGYWSVSLEPVEDIGQTKRVAGQLLSRSPRPPESARGACGSLLHQA